LISFCSLMNLLHYNLTFIWQIFIDNVSVFNPNIHELRIEFRNWEIILLKYGNFMFQLEPSSSIILIINLLEIGPHLSYSDEWSEIENNMRINRAYDPCHNLVSLTSHTTYLFGWFSLLGTELVSSTWPQRFLITFDKYLELEYPCIMVLAIEANE